MPRPISIPICSLNSSSIRRPRFFIVALGRGCVTKRRQKPLAIVMAKAIRTITDHADDPVIAMPIRKAT